MQTLDLVNMPLAGTSLIEASAGTGKTYTIAQLVLRLITEAQDNLLTRALTIEEILVVTFTKAATQELKDRIGHNIAAAIRYIESLECSQSSDAENVFDQTIMAIIDKAIETESLLGESAQNNVARQCVYQRLREALLFLDDAPIFTIHGFCQRVLADFSFATGQPSEQMLLESADDILLELAEKLWRQYLYSATTSQAKVLLGLVSSPQQMMEVFRPTLDADLVDVCMASASTVLTNKDDFSRAIDDVDDLYQQAVESWQQHRSEIEAYFVDGIGRSYTRARAPLWLSELDHYLAAADSVADWGKAERFCQSALDEKLLDRAPQHALFCLLDQLQTTREQLTLALYSLLRSDFLSALNEYQQQHNVMFFDDLIKRLAHVLSVKGEVRKGTVEDAELQLSKRLATTLRTTYPVALIDEFQDTDQWQYQIFRAIYHQQADSACLMIGDPKQAIYSFRGADINSYFQARDDVASERRYTLKTNYRSKPELVNNVNQLFIRQSDAFCIADFPSYPQVDSPLAFAEKRGLDVVIDGQVVDANLSLIQLDGNEKTTKVLAQQQAANKTALMIQRLLSAPALINNKPIEPADIAILVRKSSQAMLMKQALAEVGVSSVFLARDSVLLSNEAQMFIRLLYAVAQPFDLRIVNAALCDDLIGYSATSLKQLQLDVEAMHLVHRRFIDAHDLWGQRGFMPMWQLLLREFSIAESLLRHESGERRLTNLNQLAEIFQPLDEQAMQMAQKIATFQRWVNDTSVDDEHQKLRLETEANLVEIVTIHKSKGLEYPLVCCPFLFEGVSQRSRGFDRVYNPETTCRELYWQSPDTVRSQVNNEQFAEDVRLLYVALTRAAYHFNFCWGGVKGIDQSALYHLLYGRQNSLKVLGEEHFWQVFDELEGVVINPHERSFLASENDDVNRHTSASSTSVSDLLARTFDGYLEHGFIARSYSALMNHEYAAVSASATMTLNQEDGRDRDEAALAAPVLPEPEFEADIFHFPKGSDAGNFMHQLLEDVIFDDAEAMLPELLPKTLQQFGFEEQPWAVVLEQHFTKMLQTPLAPLSMALADIPESQQVKEMAFYLHANKGRGEDIARILQAYRRQVAAGSIQDLNGCRSSVQSVSMLFNDMAGLFKGFIDLVFEYQGQYFVLDYKSNFLGYRSSDYHACAMHVAIEDHYYDLQYLIYVAALQRYLKQRLPNYCYEKHLGGVFYLFVRGMHQDSDEGVYFVRPPVAIIDELESLFQTHDYSEEDLGTSAETVL